MHTLAIIPARGGSKGVPQKNMREVGGKPLVVWTILAAKACLLVNDCYVSTDDPHIASIAEDWGCQVIHRPFDLASDSAPMDGVVRHAISTIEAHRSQAYDIFLLLQPTSPMRTHNDIEQSLLLFMHTNAASVVSVYKVEDNHPQRMYRINDQGFLIPCMQRATITRRQDLPAVFHRNGAIYACRMHLARETGGLLLHEPLMPYIMPMERSINIDNEQDILLANILLNTKQL
jgi:CMP-N-acetylneuraminic acid synthetase